MSENRFSTMFKFSFRREKDKKFKNISHGLVPAASIAPKAAVPRTPPPRSPNPSPERPRSALAAAILSSSLTGQMWAIPPTRLRSFSESSQSDIFTTEPNKGAGIHTRGRWSDDLASDPNLSSPEHSEQEMEAKKKESGNEEDREDHVYQSLERRENNLVTEPVYALPHKQLKTSTAQSNQMPNRRESSPDFTEETSFQYPEENTDSKIKDGGKSPGCQKEPLSATMPPHHPSRHKKKGPKRQIQLSSECHTTHGDDREERARTKPKKSPKTASEPKLQEQEMSERQTSSNLRFSAGTGSQAELQDLRQQAQELVDDNDALKLTVHRLNVELSQYQARFRPLSKQEKSKISGLPKTGSPPPWLVDMKYLSPLLLAYEDRMKEKDELLQTTEEEVRRLRARVEEVIQENERLHDDVAKMAGFSHKDFQQLQQQAFLVLQENQVLLNQLDTEHARHQSEVTKVTKQLMLLEEAKQRLEEELVKSREEAKTNVKEVQVLQTRLRDAVTQEEHCSITENLRRQCEQQESKTASEMTELLHRLSSLQEENTRLAWDKSNLADVLKRTQCELELEKQANRKAEGRISLLIRQTDECTLKKETTLHYMEAVLSVVEHISKERDQLLHMASLLQLEKKGFISRVVNGAVQFGMLEKEIRVYRKQASTRLAALEEEVEGRTASYQREILHLQRLLRERQEAEERLLQSKREVEEELEVAWKAATRDKQRLKESLLDSKLLARSPHGSGTLLTSAQSSDLQERASSPQHNSLDKMQKNGMDFYC
ncbi:centrosomal protein of 89 kDa isoform X2 [Takifugu flavidus]|uniref:centrosomal protein of 89 kDa isoform X2 n=1 Tax=Takifugu flavidus TaxID=433684 RepID=UPI002544C43A|nr:centrosomal protein of 89 kDa isoform X2 [Takifugu flavidus]